MSTATQTALRAALRARYGAATTVAREFGTYPQALHNMLRDNAPALHPADAKRLAHLATRELNAAIAEHTKTVRELQRLGRELREAYDADYSKEMEE